MKLSAIVIAKNEEAMISECLDSLSFCDEIIVINNDSSDKTENIAKKLGAKVYNLNTFDFSELRNLGLNKAQGEWLLYIDADERISNLLRESVKSHISNYEYRNIKAYKIKRKNFYLGNNEWPYIEKLERLFKKDSLKGWKGQLHESPLIDGNVEELDGFLLHYTHRDLSSMLTKTIEWSKIEAELRYKTSHPKITWWRLPRVMLTAFFDSYIKQQGYRAGTAGLIESIYQSFSMFITYARLWELQQKLKI
ncbi:MAG: glycosyltransferase family 2 protein [Actinobacteria bacterium]|nr:glycosyltransferase family 2 protein [Actinomycetota bacterium]